MFKMKYNFQENNENLRKKAFVFYIIACVYVAQKGPSYDKNGCHLQSMC